MGSDALPDLVALSDDLNLHVRRAVAQSLAGIENLTPEAKSALIRLSQDEETAEFARDAVEVHDLTAITSLPFTKREVKVPFPGELSGSSELLLDLLKTWQESLPEMQRQFDLEELAEVDRALSSLIIYLRDAKNDSSPEF